MLLEHKHYYGLGLDALVTVCSWNTSVIVVMGMDALVTMLLEHKRYWGLSIGAPVTACSWNTNV